MIMGKYMWVITIIMDYTEKCSISTQARQTRPNSGGVAEGQSRFDKGGVAIIFYALKISLFRVFTLSD